MQYDFNLQPNGGQVIDVKGRFVKYRSGTGYIRVRLSSGGYADLLPGQGIFNMAFDSLTVSDRTGLANIGTILAGDFDFRDDRITGTVDVVDGGKARTLAGLAYMASNALTSAAAQYPSIQLWNPPGSGRNLVVEKISAAHTSQGLIDMGRTSAPIGAAFKAPTNKNLSIAGGSVAQCRYQSSAALPMVAADVMFNSIVAGMALVLLPLNEPIVVGPGMGLCIMSEVQNVALNASFEYFEEAL